ncbi:Helix-turn-helix domain-containing protein [Halobacillus karajensis]|uniref:helix-turn-helix domain-containing protein n=1 Tax=Halobacillus karajensis TaxID=195088 RepID=UPI0008A770CC|nr:helix-turn-helix domain-containing protein [Halobacillus karajensis]SEH76999.1 Helix-turn-helix domain-containing protein [Halobacillus karajensis]
MKKKEIGEVIKELRLAADMSQKELAEGICSQAQISKLEKGSEFPYSVTLYPLAQRLGVDMNYFFEVTHNPDIDYVKKIRKKIRYFIRLRDYKSVNEIVQSSIRNPLFSDNESQQFLFWHLGIVKFYLEGNKTASLNLLEKAKNMTYNPKFHKERELEIMNSIGIIQNETKDYHSAYITYIDVLKHLRSLPKVKDELFEVRILYSISRNLAQMGRYEEAIEYSLDGIESCKTNESLYLLGELKYMVGYSYLNLDNQQLGSSYIFSAVSIFENTEQFHMRDEIKKQMKKFRINIT